MSERAQSAHNQGVRKILRSKIVGHGFSLKGFLSSVQAGIEMKTNLVKCLVRMRLYMS